MLLGLGRRLGVLHEQNLKECGVFSCGSCSRKWIGYLKEQNLKQESRGLKFFFAILKWIVLEWEKNLSR